MKVTPVEGLDDPRVAEYRSLRRIAKLRRERTFVAEGVRVIRQLLTSPMRVHSALLEPQWMEEFGPALEARGDPDLEVFLTSRAEVERIVGYHVHQGAMAIAEVPEPPPLLDVARATPAHVLVAVCGVSSAENVGGILRNAAAFGASGVLLDPATCDPYVRRAARVSMGAIFRVPVWRADDMAAALRALRDGAGTRAIAAHTRGEVVDLEDADLSSGLALVLGSEATGIPDDVVAACDVVVRIPMAGDWQCLNVATCGAVFLWEIRRRR